MPPQPDEKSQPDAFKSGLAFVVALLPALVLVGVLFPNGSDCAPDGDCGFSLTRYFGSGALPALLVIAGAIITLVWLVFGLRFFLQRLNAMTAAKARNALFFYAILTCAVFFLVLPLAIVTVLLVAVLGEIVLRFGRKRHGNGAQ